MNNEAERITADRAGDSEQTRYSTQLPLALLDFPLTMLDSVNLTTGQNEVLALLLNLREMKAKRAVVTSITARNEGLPLCFTVFS